MAVLLLDPIVLTAAVTLAVYVGAVWLGRLDGWLGRDDWWTVLAWPAPVLLFVVPPIAGGTVLMLRQLGVEFGDGTIVSATIYMGVFLVPLALLVIFPPRWLLPHWARKRIASPPRIGTQPATIGAPLGATVLHGTAGHGSRARWVWRVGAIPGALVVDGSHLRFEAAADPHAPPGDGPIDRRVLDDDDVRQLELRDDGELRLEPPRGGWWTRLHLDVELLEVDRWHVHARRPWRRDGVLTLEVDGRPSIHVWTKDLDALVHRVRPHLPAPHERAA